MTVKSISNIPNADQSYPNFYSQKLHPATDFILSAGQGPWQVAENLIAQGYYPELSVLDLNDLIVQWNGSGSAVYRAGARIKVAPPAPYTLKAGDSPWRVAQHLHAQGYYKHIAVADLAAALKPLLPVNDWRAGMMLRPATLAPAPTTGNAGVINTTTAIGDTTPPLDYVARSTEGPWQIAQTLKNAGFYQSLTVDQLYNKIKLWNAIGDSDVRPGMTIKVEAPPAYVVPEGKAAYSAAMYFLKLGYFQGTPGKNIVEKANALGLDIQKWPSAQGWAAGKSIAPDGFGSAFPLGTQTITYTATDTGGQAATSSMTAPRFASYTQAQPEKTGADNFSNPTESAHNGAAWAFPTVRDQRIDMVRWGHHQDVGQGWEFLSGFEVGMKWKIRTVDRDNIDGQNMYKGRSGQWQPSGGWTMLDSALDQIPWYKRFNEKFGGFSASVGFRPVRFNAGDPRVKGDGYISTEAPRWEVEAKLGSLINSGGNALGTVLTEASGAPLGGGMQRLVSNLGKLSAPTLNRLSVQVSDYVAYDSGGMLGFQSDAPTGEPFQRGDLIRYGLKYELPFKVLGRDASLKARFNASGEVLGFDFQVYNKQWDENLAEVAANRLPGRNIFKRFADHTRSTPELSMESGVNFPVRFYKDTAGHWYMRFPMMSGALRLTDEMVTHMKPMMAAMAVVPEIDPTVAQEKPVDFHDLSVIQLPEMPFDPVTAFDRVGDYAHDPRASLVADGVNAIAGGSVADAKAGRGDLTAFSDAIADANPAYGGNPLDLIANTKRWAAGDQFRGNRAEDWLSHNGGVDGTLGWLPYAFEGRHLDPFKALTAFRLARDTGANDMARQMAADVIAADATLGLLTLTDETLRHHGGLAANQTLTSVTDVQAAIDRVRTRLGENTNEYRAFLRELANPTVDFGHADLAAMNRVYYAFVNSDLDVPARGMKTMGGRFPWDPDCQNRLRGIVQGDIEAKAPIPTAYAGGGMARAEDDVLAALPAHDEKTLSALEAGEIWQKQPYEAAFTIEQILNQGLATPFDLARQMQNNIPRGDSQTDWPDIIKANDSDAVRAFDLARQTMQIMDQWLMDARKNFNGRSGMLDKTKPVTDASSMMVALIDLKAAYTVAGRLDLYNAHMDALAKVLGPYGATFSSINLEQALRRNGYTPQRTDLTNLLYGSNVKAGR